MSDGESLEQLKTSLHRASSIRNASVIIGGDFNLPGWYWRSTTLKPNATYPNLHQQFLDIINNNGLAQIVEDSTRLDNTLDLILTNSPSKVLQTDTLSGILDHDIVYSEFDFRPVIHRQKPRSIPLYNKADWDSIRLDMMNLLKDLTDIFNDTKCTANTMWNTFRDTLINSTSKNIPHKTAKNKNGHPWIDAELKKQIRRQQRLYKKMKKTGDPDIKKAYRKHKRQLQKLTRQAYWRYIEGIITPDDLDRPYTGMKKFWTYIKHRRKDNSGAQSPKLNG